MYILTRSCYFKVNQIELEISGFFLKGMEKPFRFKKDFLYSAEPKINKQKNQIKILHGNYFKTELC